MLVNKTIENEDGSATFQGELSPIELDYVVQVGLNYLMFHKLLPIAEKSVDLHVAMSKEVQ